MKSLRTADHLRLTTSLIAAREKSGLTQQQLADRLDKPQSFVAKYEGGERRLDVIELIAIAHALEVDVARLVRELASKYRPARRLRSTTRD